MRSGIICCILILFTWCVSATCALASETPEVNVYSARKEALIKPLLDRFTQDTGIRVNLVTGDADALIQRLIAEAENSPADVLITVDAGRLYRAKEAGVLQPIDNPVLNSVIPEHYRDTENYWFGLSVRTRLIAHHKDRVDPATLHDYEDLADPKWKNRICVRSSNSVYNQSLVASLIAHDGTEKTEQWVRRLVANLARKPQGGDRDQIKAIAAGQCDIALVNNYYVGQMLNGTAQDQAAANEIKIIFPNQNNRGTHVNISGAGMTTSAKHPENVMKLLEYMVGEDAQHWYAETNLEYPIRSDVPVARLLQGWGNFKADVLALSELGERNIEAVILMDRAGWR